MAFILSEENTDNLTDKIMPFIIATTTPDFIDHDKAAFSERRSSHRKENATTYIITNITVDTIFAIVGTLINVWFLAAMLKSPEIRSRMRNKIICGALAVHLIESAIRLPIMATHGIQSLRGVDDILNCDIFITTTSLYHIQDFIGNWYIFILVCVYTAQVMNFEPRFAPKITTAVVITSPWVLALLLVLLTMDISEDLCLELGFEKLQFFSSLDIIVPLALASLLLVVTAALKYRRYPYIHLSDILHAPLTEDFSNIDPLCPFVAVVVTAVVTDLCLAVSLMNFEQLVETRWEIWIKVLYVLYVMGFLRLILVPVMLLLFPDIREGIKTWRPCRRSARPEDLVVTFEKNVST